MKKKKPTKKESAKIAWLSLLAVFSGVGIVASLYAYCESESKMIALISFGIAVGIGSWAIIEASRMQKRIDTRACGTQQDSMSEYHCMPNYGDRGAVVVSRKKKKKVGFFKRIIVWLVCVFLMLFWAVLILPTDETNTVILPGWYAMAIVLLPAVVAFSFGRIQALERVRDYIKQKSADVARKREYENLSESEKWKLDKMSPENSTSFVDEPQQASVSCAGSRSVDALTDAAAMVIFETRQASVSMIQRKLGLEYAKAARIMDSLESLGVVGPFVGTKPRDILITKDEYLKRINVTSDSAPAFRGVDHSQILKDEDEWRHSQQRFSPAEYELKKVDSMEGHDFEHWCSRLLLDNGFSDAEVTRGSGDQGVDIVAVKDGVRYAIQCKCYSSSLGNKPVQEVFAGKEMYGCQVGAVMTNNYFTAGAKELAEKTRVLLWDRDDLNRMLSAPKQ